MRLEFSEVGKFVEHLGLKIIWNLSGLLSLETNMMCRVWRQIAILLS